MGWREDRSEHAALWNGVVGKIISNMGKEDLQVARVLFLRENQNLLGGADEDAATAMFVCWLLSRFCVDSMPVIPWFMKKHGKKLTSPEKEILTAAREYRFGVFRIGSNENRLLALRDTGGEPFLVETNEQLAMKPGEIILAWLFSKGNGRWFGPGRYIKLDPKEVKFDRLARHRHFVDSWHGYLVGFFDYLQKEQHLSERTADKHTENAHLLLMYLEDVLEVDSFSSVTKPMVKDGLKKFAMREVLPKPDMDKVYYSLFKFFDYLEWEKKEKNDEVLNWLHARI